MILSRLRQRYPLVGQTLDEFARDRCGLLAASLAFHALLAVAPLAIVAVATAGIFLGRGAAHAELLRVLEENFGAKGASAIEEWVNEASSGGEAASAVGLALMVLAASKLGTRLREVLNLLWDIDADALVPSARVYVRRRLLAVGLVALTGPTLLLIFASRALLTAFHA